MKCKLYIGISHKLKNDKSDNRKFRKYWVDLQNTILIVSAGSLKKSYRKKIVSFVVSDVIKALAVYIETVGPTPV